MSKINLNVSCLRQAVLWLAILCAPTATWAQSYDCEEELFSKKDRKSRLFGYVNMLGEYRVPPIFLRAMPFVGKNAIVQEGKKFGVINCEGVQVVLAEYDEIASFFNGKGWMKKNGLWGLVDVKGKVLLPFVYEDILEVNKQNGSATWVKKAGFWSLMNRENGRPICPGPYQDVSNLSDSAGIGRNDGKLNLVYYGDGRVIVKDMRQMKRISSSLLVYESVDRKWGAFNSLAFIKVRPVWDDLKLNGPVLQVAKEGKIGLISLQGVEVVEPQFEVFNSFVDGFASGKKAGLWGISDFQGKAQGQGFVYQEAKVLSGRMAILTSASGTGLYDLTAKKWALKPGFGQLRAANHQKWVLSTSIARRLVYLVANRDSLIVDVDSISLTDPFEFSTGYRGDKQFLLSPPKFEAGQAFSKVRVLDPRLAIVATDGKFGLASPSNLNAVPLQYQKIDPVLVGNSRFFVVQKNGLFGVLNEGFKEVLLPSYQTLKVANPGFWIASKEGKTGLLSSNQTWSLEPKFDSLQCPMKVASGDFSLVAFKKGKGKLANSKGEELTDFMEDTWQYLGEGAWSLATKKGIQLYNGAGKPQGAFLLEEVSNFSEGNIPVKQNSKWGFANLFGKLVIPCQFEEALPFQKGMAFVKQGGKWGILNRNGSWKVKPIGLSLSQDEQGNRKLVLP